MINLNNISNEKPYINKEIILKELSEFEIYNKYIKTDFKIKEVFKSPFRDENIPSFGIFRNNKGRLIYNDFVLGGGDVFTFVKYYCQLNNFYDVCSRIGIDFGLNKYYICNEKLNKITTYNNKKYNKPIEQKDNIKLNVRIRKFKPHDVKFWRSYEITALTLSKYRVYPISHIFLKTSRRESIIAADKYAYCYIECKDDDTTYKIYQPYSKYKWMNNHDASVWQGWDQLPETGENLIITKSLKDVMCIKDTFGMPAIALQNEKIKPKKHIVEELISRFDNIYLLYDNDFDKDLNYGQQFAYDMCTEYPIFKNIFIDKQYKCKDYSDLVKKYGSDTSIKILKELIKKTKREIDPSLLDDFDNYYGDGVVPF